ncbi:hypothetical protein H012_gp567 [Acanthamoeba polyphaga moumouvirus]|uniref:Uncharacterized protein n=1 Tax=Acanthamoeba polyphaga moumouvirus TaxID=1269028 RepID=L7RCD6_9VIRU|nr:hypothetical protein H012_gp567 [Acanthamoeba polyphaga moumouvirus]AGC01896.1 hypothetical protein Moumou_00356 [Acanthamoeba polyphaga moumouvirus]
MIIKRKQKKIKTYLKTNKEICCSAIKIIAFDYCNNNVGYEYEELCKLLIEEINSAINNIIEFDSDIIGIANIVYGLQNKYVTSEELLKEPKNIDKIFNHESYIQNLNRNFLNIYAASFNNLKKIRKDLLYYQME